MALKVLLLRKKLTDKQTELRTLEKAAEGFEAREQELAADIEAAQTDEERSAVEGAVEAFETERSDNDQQRAAIRAAIEALEAEIRTAEDAAKEARTGKPAGNERKDVTHMETAETRTRFFGLTIQERDAFIQREDVQAFLTRVREMKGQNRSVTGAELGIPTVMLDLLRENIGRYSKLISRVRYKPLKGKAGRTSPAPCRGDLDGVRGQPQRAGAVLHPDGDGRLQGGRLSGHPQQHPGG